MSNSWPFLGPLAGEDRYAAGWRTGGQRGQGQEGEGQGGRPSGNLI